MRAGLGLELQDSAEPMIDTMEESPCRPPGFGREDMPSSTEKYSAFEEEQLWLATGPW